MIVLEADRQYGEQIESDLFGANYLFTFGDEERENAVLEATQELGVSALRYPGGNVTETYFDMSNPDNTQANVPDSEATVDLVPISEFIAMAVENDLAVGIVLPTRNCLSDEVDKNGDRYAEIPEDDLRTFVLNLLSGNYGDVDIASFEIGNEYWFGGEMTAVEYGRVATQMTEQLKQIYEEFEETYGVPVDAQILVQSGSNYRHSSLNENYPDDWSGQQILDALEIDYGIEFPASTFLSSSGGVKWTSANNELILHEFRETGQLDNIDGVVSHLYSRGSDNPGSRDGSLEFLENTWLNENPELSIHVTEWNQKSNTNALDPEEDYGLLQAHEILNVVEEFAQHDVESAFVWPVIHNTRNSLTEGFNDDPELTPAGEMFRLMVEELVGTKAIQFNGAEQGESEAGNSDIDVHSFYDDGKLVLYVASKVDEVTDNYIDISSLISDYGDMEITILGVESGSNPGDSSARLATENVDVNEETYSDEILALTLDAYEIAQIVIEDPTWTAEFIEAMLPDLATPEEPEEQELDTTDTSELSLDEFPFIEPTGLDLPPEESSPDEVSVDEDSGILGDMAWLLLIPLLGLLGAMG